MFFTNFIISHSATAIHYGVIFALCLITAVYYSSGDDDRIYQSKNGLPISIALLILFSLFWGSRPYDPTYHFGDTWLYAYSYENLFNNYMIIDLNTEWLWNNLAYACRLMGLSTTEYFIVIEALYIGFTWGACYRLTRNNVWMAFLFCVASYSFLSYGVNGIRNGLACSIVMFAISMLNKQEKKNYLYAALLLIAATGIHTSAIVPATALVLSVLLIKRTKAAIVIWLVSIIISLIVGNSIIQLIPDFGLDMSRFEQYISMGEDSDAMQHFANTGFRLDFLLYSAVPIIMVWYLTIKRNFNDFTYNVIANTYILANSFWIIVIRAAYTNRFAYLSWFLYPIVIVYPLVRMKVWENQNQKVAWILMAYVGFTVTMFLLGK